MMSTIIRSVALILFVVNVNTTVAQGQIDDTKPIPFNSNVVTGKLQHNIPYYILKNSKPEKRLDLILTINAGAVLEDDDQNGLAHFCEHMAFNGTKEFPKQELVKFLESTGIRFGADLNAYTNQDETVYMLTIPVTSVNNVITGVKVLRDWAGYVTYSDEDIEAERGVVMEEWRLGRGANERVTHKHFPAMYYGSPYANRNVIGDTAVLRHAPPDALRRFYKTWYRPENMAVIAVGDIEPRVLTEILQKYFVLQVENSGNERSSRPQFILPDHKQSIVSIASDPELQTASCQVIFKNNADTVVTYADFRKSLVKQLGFSMINSRLRELTQKPKPPFANAFVGIYPLARENRSFYGRATSAEKNVLTAFNALMTELQRVKLYGFTDSELQRAKDEMSASMETAYNERDKTESQQLAFELSRHVLTVETVPGIVHETEIYRHYLPGITVAECADALRTMMRDESQVYLLSVPEGNGYIMPKEQQVHDLLAAVANKKIEPYVDNVITTPLLATMPTPGSIVKSEYIAEVDAKKLTLSNGATVFLKKTDFKNDEILFEATGFGGQSLGADADHITLSFTASLVDESGIADITITDLQKMLQGKNLSLSPYIGMETQGLSGSAAPRDFETMMQLAYLYFTAPRVDADAVQSWKTRMKAQLDNKEKNPEAALFDSLMYIMSGRHLRAKPVVSGSLDKIDSKKALEFYKARFANAAGFTFLIVGNYDEKQTEDFIKTYLASLPGNTKKREMWKDVGMKTPHDKIDITVLKGKEPKSFVVLAYTGDGSYNPQSRYDLSALSEVMTIRLREQMREEASGVYFVVVQPQIEKIPHEEYTVAIVFSCAPDRVDELIGIVEKEVDYLKNNVVEDSYIQKVREIHTKEREVQKKRNQFWLNGFKQVVQTSEPFDVINERDKLIAGLSKEQIKASASKYLNPNSFAKFKLKPATN